MIFIQYNEKLSFYNRIINYLFRRINIDTIDNNRCIVSISNKNLKEKQIEALKTLLIAHKIKYVAFGKGINSIIVENFENDKRFYILDGKLLMKYMSKEILEYIFLSCNLKEYETDLYITTQSDKYIDIILDISKDFRNLNLVTNITRKLKRCDQRLEKTHNIVYSISCNRLKALRKAKIIVNFDFDNKIINSFKIRNDAIIINLSSNKLNMGKSFHGIVIEGLGLCGNKNDFMLLKNFNKEIIIESYFVEKSYAEARKILYKNNYRINEIHGKHGVIQAREIEGNIY